MPRLIYPNQSTYHLLGQGPLRVLEPCRAMPTALDLTVRGYCISGAEERARPGALLTQWELEAAQAS